MKPGLKEQEKGLNSKESYFIRKEIHGKSENPHKRKVLWKIKLS